MTSKEMQHSAKLQRNIREAEGKIILWSYDFSVLIAPQLREMILALPIIF